MRKLVVLGVLAAALMVGTAGAASRWVITSTHQIKPSVLKQLHGKQGPRGRQGPAGSSSSASKMGVHQYAGPSAALCATGASCDVGASDARCTSGPVLGGGWDGETNPPVDATEAYNEPDADGMGWHIIVANNAFISANVHAIAMCASSGATVARAGVPATVRTQIQRELHAALAR